MALPFEGNPLGFIIGNTPINLNAYALFQLDSTTKGMVTPRMNTAQMNAIPATFKGIEIFNTDTNTKWFTNGTIWVELTAGGAGLTTASNGLTVAVSDVKLGGTLTASTKIDPATFGLSIGAALPNSLAVLDLQSTNKGFLIPRMTEAQRLLIGGGSGVPALLVYQIDAVIGFYFYDGVGWRAITARRNTLASGAYNILTTDTDIANTANGSTFTLPASSVGQEYAIWVGNYTGFTLAANGLELIMGESTQSLDPWTMITVKCFVVGEWLVGR
jgi:hypothetical protein